MDGKGKSPVRNGKGAPGNPYWYEYNAQSPMTTLAFTPSTGIFRGTSKAYYDHVYGDGRVQHTTLSVPYSGVMIQNRGKLFFGAGACLVTDTTPALKACKIKWSGIVLIY